MSETFEEYLVNSPHINNHTITTLDESQMWEIERCWNHQQKKIDEKDARIAELTKKVFKLEGDCRDYKESIELAKQTFNQGR